MFMQYIRAQYAKANYFFKFPIALDLLKLICFLAVQLSESCSTSWTMASYCTSVRTPPQAGPTPCCTSTKYLLYNPHYPRAVDLLKISLTNLIDSLICMSQNSSKSLISILVYNCLETPSQDNFVPSCLEILHINWISFEPKYIATLTGAVRAKIHLSKNFFTIFMITLLWYCQRFIS